MIRLFAALAIPDDLIESLLRLQQPMPGARWRPAESLHLTLRFFGEVREDIADDLDSALSTIAGAPFSLQLQGVATSGEGAEITSLWARVSGSEPLRRLAGRC